MLGALLVTIVVAPLAVVAGSLILPRAATAQYLNLASSAVVFACVLLLPALALNEPRHFLGGYVILDAPGAWVLLCTACVYLLSSIYAVGYMRLLDEERRLPHFYALFAGFALTTLVGPLMNNVGVYWIAIELTTLVSTFLVAFEHGTESIEAAWKYILVVSAGISLALLGTVLFYWGGTGVLGPTYDMTWSVLKGVAPQVPGPLMALSFLLVLLGYGAKVGLAPMHTWLPDAHSEAPAPVSAMLSGALLNTAMLGIARFVGVADAAHIGPTARAVLVALGVLSLLVAALFIVRQKGIKRLMAYSSVEHMGVLALGIGFGGVLGVAGAMYHMLNHSLNKSLMFFGAGNVMRGLGTKQIGELRGVLQRFPVTGALWGAGAVAITGAPPFGLFLSELAILRAGYATPHLWAVVAMVLLLIVIFVGFLAHFRQMYFDENGNDRPLTPLSAWCLAPMWLALIPILVLGVWWPEGLSAFFAVVLRDLE